MIISHTHKPHAHAHATTHTHTHTLKKHVQAKEALEHPYFDTGFDRAAADTLENPELTVDE